MQKTFEHILKETNQQYEKAKQKLIREFKQEATKLIETRT